MSALQNRVCWNVTNHFSHKIEQSKKGQKNSNAIEACQPSNNWNYAFHKHRKFVLIEQLNNIKNTSTQVLKQRLKDRKNYWIKSLKILAPLV